MLELEIIDVNDYPLEKEKIFSLVDKIWVREEDAIQAKHSIDRWGTSKTETGTYFYIVQNSETIGITGYFIPNLEQGIFGLRHHGTSVKGTGRKALDLLVEYLKNKYQDSFESIVELVPEGRKDLIPKFEEWGFQVDPNGVPVWEPKRDYYRYALIRRGKE